MSSKSFEELKKELEDKQKKMGYLQIQDGMILIQE